MIPPQFPIRGVEIDAACIRYTKSQRASPCELGTEAGVTSFGVMPWPMGQLPSLGLERQKCG